jgi:peroxiredoxin
MENLWLERLNSASLSITLNVEYKTSLNKSFVREEFSMPEVGDTAPDFELPSHLEKGKKVKLSDFRGKNNVVLAFYPLAWTPV